MQSIFRFVPLLCLSLGLVAACQIAAPTATPGAAPEAEIVQKYSGNAQVTLDVQGRVAHLTATILEPDVGLPPEVKQPDIVPTTPAQEAPALQIIPGSSPLLDFPLSLGNTWVYSATHYDTYGTERITATYRITETVVDILVRSPYTAARVMRSSQVAALSDNLAGKDWQENYLAGPGSSISFWYVISGTQVYEQNELDWAKIQTGEATLTLIFPLTAGAQWYPDPEQRRAFSNFEVGPGTRTVVDEPDERKTPAGEFQDCFEILTFYNGGSPREWFCLGVGIVESEYHHQGTPFGNTTVLIDYRPAGPVLPTPAPGPLSLIRPDNAARLSQVAQLGKGTVYDLVWSPDGQDLVVGTPLGLYFYNPVTLTEQKFTPPATQRGIVVK